jgi:hypothetical protein
MYRYSIIYIPICGNFTRCCELNSKNKTKFKKIKTMNYCIIFDNQKIGIEIPVSSDSLLSTAKSYICDNFLQFTVVDPDYGFRVLKEGVGYTSVSNAIKWGYSILPL